MNDINELIELKFIELKQYIDDCFEKQSKNNAIFFNNILELIKANISEEVEINNEIILMIIKKLEKFI